MAGWSLFKKRGPRAPPVKPDAEIVKLLQKIPSQAAATPNGPGSQALPAPNGPPPEPTHRRTSSIHSHRSYRSSKSSRSSRSRSRSHAQQTIRQSRTDRRCYACSRIFNSSHCTNCDTVYSESPAHGAQPLDLTLVFELAAGDDHMLLEQVVYDTFSNAEATVRSFLGEAGAAGDGQLDLEKVDTFYQIIESPTSTAPMRAVLQGAQAVLLNRPYHAVTRTELLYLLVVQRSPAFTQCSMFTKITGPLQKLGRYSSFRSRARVVLELSLGLCSNLSCELRRELQQYYADMPQARFQETAELLNSYIGHRLMYHFQYKSQRPQNIRQRNEIKVQWYTDDWRIAATAGCLGVLFDANATAPKVPVSAFYNMVVDHVELAQDFDMWQSCERWRGSHTAGYSLGDLWNYKDPSLLNRFYFCQYPFLLPITSKTAVFRHSLERKVREHQLRAHPVHTHTQTHTRASIRAPSIMSSGSGASYVVGQATNASNSAVHAAWLASQQPAKPFLDLCVRREHLLEDSMDLLLALPAVELKKKLKIEFEGEMGIDAGGLCKEWMHLLFMELTSPRLALLVQDTEATHVWFGAGPVDHTVDHTVEYYTLMGIALGIALNNGLMIDSGLPDLAYKVLLGRPFGLADAADVWPQVAASLGAVLAYDGGDCEEAFGLTFVAPDGTPLVPGGEHLPVTSGARERYVELAVQHMARVTEQVAALRAGFLRACDTVALPMFAAVEVGALLRGERRPIDVAALRSNTRYIHWGSKANIAREPVLIWFWEWFARLDAAQQALVLVFVTATPRVPATGISTMQFRISCLGPDSDRLPVAHTCFNQLGLYRYRSRGKLEHKMMLAITECQSFGIK